MDEIRRLTYKTPDGAWGIKGVSLLTCPARLYGAAAKLCDMESLCEDVYRAKDAEEIADVGIMLDQMAIEFEVEDAVAEQRAHKVRRLRSRLEYVEQEG